jgi:gas vesicle protein
LIIPLILNEAVEGVMEFASFYLYEDHQIAFLKRVGENIASYIFNYKSNEKTRQLLKQSQEHSEQMRAQEEEMRQNLEELSATQEQMARKEREYLKKIKDLEDQALKSKI